MMKYAAPTAAISLLQPYATLVAHGYKTNETRSFDTKRRGRLAIHASLGKPAWARQACQDPHIKAALDELGLSFDTLPRGQVLCAVTITGTTPITEQNRQQLPPQERAMGDYSLPAENGGRQRYAWQLQDVHRPVASPEHLAAKGRLGFWPLPEAIGDTFQIQGLVKAWAERPEQERDPFYWLEHPAPQPAGAYVMGCDFATGPDTTHMTLLRRLPDGRYQQVPPEHPIP